MRIKNWKALGEDGGGALGNFVSHSFHYLEWLCGPITGLSARLSGLPDEPAMETNASISMAFQSGAAGSLAMSCASYLGSGHRLEFYGEDGNLDADQRDAGLHAWLQTEPGAAPGYSAGPGRSRRSRRPRLPGGRPDRAGLPSRRRASSMRSSMVRPAVPGFAEAYRVQALLDAARRANNGGRWLDTGPEVMEKQA